MKLVIFDFDGTLIKLPVDYDTLRAELRKYFRKYGIDFEFRPLKKRIREALLLVGEKFPDLLNKATKDTNDIIDKFEMAGASGSEIIGGSIKTIQWLNSNKFTMAVLSLNGKKCIEKVLKKFGLMQHFDMIVSRDDNIKSKPSSDGIERVMKKTGAKNKDVWMVGNSRYDIMAAKSIGVKSIGVLSGNKSDDDFIKDKANYVIRNNVEIINIVRGKDKS